MMDFAAKGLKKIGVPKEYRPFTSSEANYYRRTSVARKGAIKAVKAAKAAKITIAQKEYKSAVDRLLDCFRNNSEFKILGSLILPLVFFDPAAGESVAEILGKDRTNLTDSDYEILKRKFNDYKEENKTNAEALRNATNTINKLTDSAQELATSLTNKNTELTTTLAALAGINTTLTTTQANLAEKTTKLTTTLAALAGINTTLTETQANLAEKTTKLTTTLAALAGINTTLTETESDLAVKTTALEATEAKYEKCVEKNASNVVQMANLRGTIRNQTAAIAKLDQVNSNQNQKIKNQNFITGCQYSAGDQDKKLITNGKKDPLVNAFLIHAKDLRKLLGEYCIPQPSKDYPGMLRPVQDFLGKALCLLADPLVRVTNHTFTELKGIATNNTMLPCTDTKIIAAHPGVLGAFSKNVTDLFQNATKLAVESTHQNVLNHMGNQIGGFSQLAHDAANLERDFFSNLVQYRDFNQTGLDVETEVPTPAVQDTGSVTDNYNIDWWQIDKNLPLQILTGVGGIVGIVVLILICRQAKGKCKANACAFTKSSSGATNKAPSNAGLNLTAFGGGNKGSN